MSAPSPAHGRFLHGLAEVRPDRWTQPFWDAAEDHRLVCQRCADCGAFRMPPAPRCWLCRSPRDAWGDLPGTGTVHAYTTVTYAPSREIADEDLPYVVGVIRLDGTDRAKLVANIVGAEPSEVACEAPVRVDWDASGHDPTIPRFRLVL